MTITRQFFSFFYFLLKENFVWKKLHFHKHINLQKYFLVVQILFDQNQKSSKK